MEVQTLTPLGCDRVTQPAGIVHQTEAVIRKYVTFADDSYPLPLALWAIGTHMWPDFDAFAYLMITSLTKGSGKTECMGIIKGLSSDGETFSADSPASMFERLQVRENAQAPTPCILFIDEAEALNHSRHHAREFLNKGYKRGQRITRMGKQYDSYCPKCFVAIGDLYGTLKDRCIVVTMRRRTVAEDALAPRVPLDLVEQELAQIRGEIRKRLFDVNDWSVIKTEHQTAAEAIRAECPVRLEFLPNRDEEIWSPLFAIAKVLCPERLDELTRVAVDMSALKQAPARKSHGKEYEAAERAADDEETKALLVRDMLKLCKDRQVEWLACGTLPDDLKGILTSPWRTFKGRGICHTNPREIGELLADAGVKAGTIRTKSGRKAEKPTIKGYRREDLEKAAKLMGLPVERHSVTPAPE